MNGGLVKVLREWEGDAANLSQIRTVRMFPLLQPVTVNVVPEATQVPVQTDVNSSLPEADVATNVVSAPVAAGN